MNLRKKKKLAKRMLNIGEDRIIFLESRLDEIKDAITKQDILDLKKSGAIIVKEIKGRSGKSKKPNRSIGNVRKKIKNRKKKYIVSSRKLRKYVRENKNIDEVDKRESGIIKRKIRNKDFKDKSHLREFIGGLRK